MSPGSAETAAILLVWNCAYLFVGLDYIERGCCDAWLGTAPMLVRLSVSMGDSSRVPGTGALALYDRVSLTTFIVQQHPSYPHSGGSRLSLASPRTRRFRFLELQHEKHDHHPEQLRLGHKPIYNSVHGRFSLSKDPDVIDRVRV